MVAGKCKMFCLCIGLDAHGGQIPRVSDMWFGAVSSLGLMHLVYQLQAWKYVSQ